MDKPTYSKSGTILNAICERKKLEISDISEKSFIQWRTAFADKTFEKSQKLAIALSRKRISVIAEIKKGSPSEGIIRANVDVAKIAKSYCNNGASAISVVTDKFFFQGDLSWIEMVKKEVTLPVLRKDFILDEKQVYESKVAGADAVLLIAGILESSKLNELYRLVYKLGMEALVEVRTLSELESALAVGTEIIGINNRNLKNFAVGTKEFLSLVKQIPEDKIVVAESGIHSLKDVLFMKEHGADAVLVGTHLMRAEEPGNALCQIMGN